MNDNREKLIEIAYEANKKMVDNAEEKHRTTTDILSESRKNLKILIKF